MIYTKGHLSPTYWQHTPWRVAQSTFQWCQWVGGCPVLRSGTPLACMPPCDQAALHSCTALELYCTQSQGKSTRLCGNEKRRDHNYVHSEGTINLPRKAARGAGKYLVPFPKYPMHTFISKKLLPRLFLEYFELAIII